MYYSCHQYNNISRCFLNAPTKQNKNTHIMHSTGIKFLATTLQLPTCYTIYINTILQRWWTLTIDIQIVLYKHTIQKAYKLQNPKVHTVTHSTTTLTIFTNISAKSPTTGFSSFFFTNSLFIEAKTCTAYCHQNTNFSMITVNYVGWGVDEDCKLSGGLCSEAGQVYSTHRWSKN